MSGQRGLDALVDFRAGTTKIARPWRSASSGMNSIKRMITPVSGRRGEGFDFVVFEARTRTAFTLAGPGVIFARHRCCASG